MHMASVPGRTKIIRIAGHGRATACSGNLRSSSASCHVERQTKALPASRFLHLGVPNAVICIMNSVVNWLHTCQLLPIQDCCAPVYNRDKGLCTGLCKGAVHLLSSIYD